MLLAVFSFGATTTTAPATTQSNVIAEFQGDYRFLSNFYPAVVEFEGITYPTVEHAYQSAKTLDMAERKRIAACATPAEAKRAGRALAGVGKQRADWEQVKFDVMEQCVRYKFTHHDELKQKLLATGDATLEEGNNWDDRIWGISPPGSGQGDNRLGKTLMKVRDELRADGKADANVKQAPLVFTGGHELSANDFGRPIHVRTANSGRRRRREVTR